MKIISLLLFFIFSFQVHSKPFKVNTGVWHLEFQLNETTLLPVSFIVEKKKKNICLYIQNAEESIELKDIIYKNDS
jgi:hypothetical protein